MFNVMLAAQAGGGEIMSTILMLLVFIAIFWFFIIRPQKKKEQQTKDMQNSISVGDKVTTIGGMMGKVCSVKDDTIILETGADKVRVVYKKWAIGSVDSKKEDKKADEPAKEDTKAETAENKESSEEK